MKVYRIIEINGTQENLVCEYGNYYAATYHLNRLQDEADFYRDQIDTYYILEETDLTMNKEVYI